MRRPTWTKAGRKLLRGLLCTAVLGTCTAFVIPPPSPSPSCALRTLLIDNYDSYTYNLAHYLSEVNGVPPIVVYNDEYGRDWERVKAEAGAFDNIVISPGPGTPDVADDFGISAAALREADIPVLGICLGHQGLGSAHGGHVVRAPVPMHGRLGRIRHTAKGIFQGLPADFLATRYHSLVVEKPRSSAWPLIETAWTADGLIMGLEHRDRPHFGVQFHPESIGTEHGHQLLANFRDLTMDHWRQRGEAQGSRSHLVRPLTTTFNAQSIKQARLASPSKAEQEAGRCQYNVLVRRVPVSPELSTEALFASLYGADDSAFWLDSSAAHAATTPESSGQGQARVKGRFSFMGGLRSGGSLAHVVEYYYQQGQGQVGETRIIRTERLNADGERTAEVLEGESILPWLKRKMSGFRQGGVEVREQASPNGPWVGGSLPFEFWGGYVGYLGYELKDDCMAMQRQPELLHRQTGVPSSDPAVGLKDVPDCALLFADRFVAVDHSTHEALLVSLVDTAPLPPASLGEGSVEQGLAWLSATEARVQALSTAAARGDTASLPSLSSSTPRPSPTPPAELYPLASASEYRRRVGECLESIRAGESYEVCLTSQFCLPRPMDPSALYHRIRRANPAPFSAFLCHDPSRRLADRSPIADDRRRGPAVAVCCSSPERFLRLGRVDSLLESRPIKGTVRRGTTTAEDAALAASLASCEKNRAENLMIVDLVRNDVSRVARPGSVRVPSLMAVEGYATVHQLVSTIHGTLEEDRDAVDALVACFPGGSMTGAPKKRTMAIIDKLEGQPRGVYSGSLGWIALDGRAADLNIVIRTAVVTPRNVTIGAGGAVVALSDPEDEYQEMRLKAQAVAGAAFREGEGEAPQVHVQVGSVAEERRGEEPLLRSR